MENIIQVFKLNRTHGLKGEIWAQLLLPNCQEKKLINKTAFVKLDNYYLPVIIDNITLLSKKYLLSFVNLSNINEVQKFVNKDLYFSKDDIKDIITMSEINLFNYNVSYKNNIIGNINNIFATKAHYIIEIKLLLNNKLMLIPYVDDYVLKVDNSAKILYLKQVIV